MATFSKALYSPDRVRCDADSSFTDGFADTLDGYARSWVPSFGAACEVCGKGC